jgi:glycosyltransferase involved in cell wall biosynthesis
MTPTTCPDCGAVCLCHLRGDPVWDRHIAGRAALRRGERTAPATAPPPDPTPGGEPSARDWPPPGRRVVIRTFLNDWSGFGRFGVGIGKGLDAAGVEVAYEALSFDEDYRPVADFQRSRVVADPPDPWVLQTHVPGYPPRPGVATVAYTMMEASRIPQEWVGTLNQCRAIVVPCRWNADGFRASGITVPLYVVPGGVSRDEGFFEDETVPPPPDVCRFGMAARLAYGGMRKNIEAGFRAFEAAFPAHDYPDVELTYKCWADCVQHLRYRPTDPRIKIVTTPMTMPEMAEWYRTLTCLVVPSFSEGWGLHTHECMACGRPVIASFATATADYADESCAYPLDYTWETTTGYYEAAGRVGGQWAVPTQNSLVEQMRWVYHHREESAEKGKRAARKMGKLTWCAAGTQLRQILADVGMLTPHVKPRIPLGTTIKTGGG